MVFGLFTLSANAAESPASIQGKDTWSNEGLVFKTWANYSGPQVTSPSVYTTARNGKTDSTPQHLDSLLTLGYHVIPELVPGIGLPVDVSVSGPDFQLKPMYLGLIEASLYRSTYFNISADVRFYLPFGDVAQKQDFQTGFRTSQVFAYAVPGMRLTTGVKTFFRISKYGPRGTGSRNDLEIYVTPYAKYRISSKLATTIFSDILQLTHDFGKPGGLKNAPVNLQPGILWDVSSALSLNPYFSVIPAKLSAVSVGMIVNARFL